MDEAEGSPPPPSGPPLFSAPKRSIGWQKSLLAVLLVLLGPVLSFTSLLFFGLATDDTHGADAEVDVGGAVGAALFMLLGLVLLWVGLRMLRNEEPKRRGTKTKTKLTTETISAHDEQELAELIDRAIQGGFEIIERDEQLAIAERTEIVKERRNVVVRRIELADTSNQKAE